MLVCRQALASLAGARSAIRPLVARGGTAAFATSVSPLQFVPAERDDDDDEESTTVATSVANDDFSARLRSPSTSDYLLGLAGSMPASPMTPRLVQQQREQQQRQSHNMAAAAAMTNLSNDLYILLMSSSRANGGEPVVMPDAQQLLAEAEREMLMESTLRKRRYKMRKHKRKKARRALANDLKKVGR